MSTESEEVDSIINESGNSFHCRVANYLREKGWHTMISPYYMDGASNKPREIDLVAEKAWRYEDRLERRYGTVNLKLFIECKYIPQTNVFWFSEKDMVSAKNWVSCNTPLPDGNMYTAQHHYLCENQMVAKLFASKNRSQVENEVIYKALNQSLNAMVNLRHGESIIPADSHRHYDCFATVEMPVILCNSFDKFHKVDMTDTRNREKIKDNFQLEVNYAYVARDASQRNEYFLIDVVDISRLDVFLNQLESDKDAIFHII